MEINLLFEHNFEGIIMEQSVFSFKQKFTKFKIRLTKDKVVWLIIYRGDNVAESFFKFFRRNQIQDVKEQKKIMKRVIPHLDCPDLMKYLGHESKIIRPKIKQLKNAQKKTRERNLSKRKKTLKNVLANDG